MSAGSNGSTRLPLRWRMLAACMRSLPTDVRRVDMAWRGLYARLGGGGFAPDEGIDGRWPSGLQEPIRGKQHGFWMRLDLHNWSDRRAYFSGRYYQQDVSRLLLRLLRPGEQYIDVGANVGMTTLLAASRIGAQGRCLAFEPNPNALRRLEEHRDLNGLTNVKILPFAVGDCESSARLFVPGDETQLGSLAPGLDSAEKSFDVRTVVADRYTSELDPTKVTLVKIDVEGFEVQVLRGLASLLEWPEVVVVAEVGDEMLRRAGHSRTELHDVLASHGFVAHSIHVRSSRWRKVVELRKLSGPLELDKYDALFARPTSEVYHARIERLLSVEAPSPVVSTGWRPFH